MKKKIFLLIAFFSLFCFSCSGGSSTGGGAPYIGKYSFVTVDYKINETEVICFNANNINDDVSGRNASRTCIWFCGKYKEQTKVFVSLNFQNGETGWYLDHEDISSGICK